MMLVLQVTYLVYEALPTFAFDQALLDHFNRRNPWVLNVFWETLSFIALRT